MKTYVYIDGFNLYYGIRRTPYKWLNLKLLSENLLPAGTIIQKVMYYTAYVSGAVDPGQPIRQQTYLRALKTVPEIQPVFGKFFSKPVWRPLLLLPIADRRITPGPHVLPKNDYHVDGLVVERLPVGSYGVPPSSFKRPLPHALKARVHWMEEKGSDVNLAVHLIRDGWHGKYEAAAVISNDTDLVESVRIVTEELGKHVTLICPSPKRTLSVNLAAVASAVRHMNLSILKDSQFPDTVPTPVGWKPVVKPPTW